MPRIVRFQDLAPTWTTKRAREPGTMRWLVTWVGGPDGHINTNPDVAIESRTGAVGLMVLPPGQRQAGKHIHKVTEIYVVLQGTLEGFDASAQAHRAGPMDCVDIPIGCPHGVRNCGLDDVVLVWVHDGIERNDAAIYLPDDHRADDAPPIRLVRSGDLEADWSAPGAREPGTLRWSVNWVGGLTGAPDANPGVTARNSRVAIGMTMVDPGHSIPPVAMPVARLNLVIGGQAIFATSSGNTCLGHLDGLHVAAGETAALRNNGPAPLKILWVDSPAA